MTRYGARSLPRAPRNTLEGLFNSSERPDFFIISFQKFTKKWRDLSGKSDFLKAHGGSPDIQGAAHVRLFMDLSFLRYTRRDIAPAASLGPVGTP